MKEEIRKWIEQAEEDLNTAEFDFNGKKYRAAAFWCQQAIEKGFKAVLILKTNSFPKVHDLTYLARLINTPQNIKELCSKINPSYTTARYPDSPKQYTKEESEQILKYCKEVIRWIKKETNY